MAIKLASLARNIPLENDGDRIASFTYPGVFYSVRSANYAPFVKARSAALERWRRDHGDDNLRAESEEFSTIFGKLTSDYLLLGWEGLDVAYSSSIASATLIDASFSGVLTDILAASNVVGRGKVEVIEEAEKNSVPASPGK